MLVLGHSPSCARSPRALAPLVRSFPSSWDKGHNFVRFSSCPVSLASLSTRFDRVLKGLREANDWMLFRGEFLQWLVANYTPEQVMGSDAESTLMRWVEADLKTRQGGSDSTCDATIADSTVVSTVDSGFTSSSTSATTSSGSGSVASTGCFSEDSDVRGDPGSQWAMAGFSLWLLD